MNKFIAIILLSIGICADAYSTTTSDSNFEFKFKPYLGETFALSVKAKDQYEALERAAQSCFNHYKKNRSISTDEGLDIIDICVNPKML